MFTGIVQAMGTIQRMEPTAAGRRLTVDPGPWRPEPAPRAGDSVCVSGVCLTLLPPAEFPADGHLRFDVVTETLTRTTLGTLTPGGRVNLEPSLTALSPLGGHFVQGHVEGVAEVVRVQAEPADWRIELRPPGDLMACIAPKGSVTIDGVSMTVARVTATTFEVAVIPTTLAMTTLGAVAVGARINLETDILARSVVHVLGRLRAREPEQGVTTHLLREAGFLA